MTIMDPYCSNIERIIHGGKTAPHCLILAGSTLPAFLVTSDFSSVCIDSDILD